MAHCAEAHPLGVVADRHLRDLPLRRVVDHHDLVVAADRQPAVRAAQAVGGPVGLLADRDDRVGERVPLHDRGVVRHRPGRAERRALRVHRQTVVRRVEQVHLARGGLGLLAERQVGDAQHPVLLEVVLDEAVVEGDLRVERALVGRQGHRPHRRVHLRIAGLLELMPHVDALQHLHGVGVHDLEPAIALGRVADQLERRCQLPVGRRVGPADAGVEGEGDALVLRPVRVSSRCTLFAVESDTSRLSPSGEIAMWSERWPSIGKRQTICPVSRLIPTTSAKLGRDTYTNLPSCEVNMSSVYWSLPSPTPWRMARKNACRSGSRWISASRSSLSGIVLMRASRSKVRASTMSAVPSQLLPTNMTGRVSGRWGGPSWAAAVPGPAASSRARAATPPARHIDRLAAKTIRYLPGSARVYARITWGALPGRACGAAF